MQHRFIRPLLASLVMLVAFLSISGLPVPGAQSVPVAEAMQIQYQDPTPGCPSYTLIARSQDAGSVGLTGIAIIIKPDDRGVIDPISHEIVYPNYLPFERADIEVSWRNWSAPVAGPVYVGGYFYGKLWPGGKSSFPDWIYSVNNYVTGPGAVAVQLRGHVILANDYGTCEIPGDQLKTWSTIKGISDGIPFTQNDLIPQTADLDNNNVSDDTHCGNICNKNQDQATDTERNKLRVKICYRLDKTNDRKAFKSCKASGNLAIGAREGRGWKCWYEANRDGWKGPTAPENARANPDGTPYTGRYYGDGCGFQVPALTPVPDMSATKPPPTITGCTLVSDGNGSGYYSCDSNDGGVHIQSTTDHIAITTDLAPTPTPVAWPQIYVSPESLTTGDTLTMEFASITAPTSNDALVLYNADTGARQPLGSSSGQGGFRIFTDNCSASSHGSNSLTFGTCTVVLNSHLPQGNYEVRVYHNPTSTNSGSDSGFVEASNVFVRTPNACEIDPNQCSG